MAIRAADILKPNGSFTIVEPEDIKIGDTNLADYLANISAGVGEKGDTGNGISSIAKTASSGTDPVVDTYTVTFTDGSTTTFNVTNGKKGEKGDTGDAGAKGETGNSCHAKIEESTDIDGTKHVYLKVWDGEDESTATSSGDLMGPTNEVLAAIEEIMGSYSSMTETQTTE